MEKESEDAASKYGEVEKESYTQVKVMIYITYPRTFPLVFVRQREFRGGRREGGIEGGGGIGGEEGQGGRGRGKG